MTNRERVLELAKQLREAAARQVPEARAVIELVRLSVDELKESLVSAAGDDMLRTQGAARQLQKLLKELTTEPPSIKAQEKK